MFKVHHDSAKQPHQYDANHAVIENGGQLVLLSDSGNNAEVIAVYAPGSWLYAENTKPPAT